MEKDKYFELLKKEMVVAMGCTEPLALAYIGSVGRFVLKSAPTEIRLQCSNNIIKNVRCVDVPNSTGFKGVKASLLLGIFGGDYRKGFSCISDVTAENKEKAKDYLKNGNMVLEHLSTPEKLHIILQLSDGINQVLVETKKTHLNITRVEKNNEILFSQECVNEEQVDYEELLMFDNIYDYSNNVDLDKLKDLLDTEFKYNLEIAKAGIEGNYGIQIGKHILERDHTLDGKIIAYTSAASEARMCGCVKPVVINSGSGNQGLSTSLPVIIYGLENNYPKEEIYRALVFANLLTIKQKYRLGTLSAFCGVTSSCGAAGAALTYLCKGTKEQIKMTLNNHLAIIPGMICDGAKDSCSGKIFAALSSSLMSFHLAMEGKSFKEGHGILKDTIDKTIDVVSCIGSDGMISTDDEIMKVLLD